MNERSQITRRRLVIGAGAVLAAAGCGAGSDGDRGKRAAGAKHSASPTPKIRTPPPAAIPDEPKLQALGTLEHHNDRAYTICFSPDGTILATLHATVLRLWNATDGKLRATSAKSSKLDVTSLAFSPDGRTVATGGAGRIRFWDVATLRPLGREITDVGDEAGDSAPFAFRPDGKSLVAAGGGEDGTIRIYDLATRSPVGAFVSSSSDEFSSGVVSALALSRDGRTLASVDDFGAVTTWDVRRRNRRARGELDDLEGDYLALSPDGSTVAVNSLDAIHCLSATTGKHRGKPLGGHIGSITGLAYSTDGKTIVTSDYSGLRFWNAATHEKRATAEIPGSAPDVKHLAGTSYSGPVGGGKLVVVDNDGITITRPGGRSIEQFALSPDGRTLATVAVKSGRIAIWRLD